MSTECHRSMIVKFWKYTRNGEKSDDYNESDRMIVVRRTFYGELGRVKLFHFPPLPFCDSFFPFSHWKSNPVSFTVATHRHRSLLVSIRYIIDHFGLSSRANASCVVSSDHSEPQSSKQETNIVHTRRWTTIFKHAACQILALFTALKLEQTPPINLAWTPSLSSGIA